MTSTTAAVTFFLLLGAWGCEHDADLGSDDPVADAGGEDAGASTAACTATPIALGGDPFPLQPRLVWNGTELGLAYFGSRPAPTGDETVWFTRLDAAGARLIADVDVDVARTPGLDLDFIAPIAWLGD